MRHSSLQVLFKHHVHLLSIILDIPTLLLHLVSVPHFMSVIIVLALHQCQFLTSGLQLTEYLCLADLFPHCSDIEVALGSLPC